MSKTEYLTAPLKTDQMPPGIPYIVGNEAASGSPITASTVSGGS
jgi:hypothetical protein